MHFFCEKENNKDWKNAYDEEGREILTDPVLKQKVIKATRRYVESKFADETEDLQVSVSVVRINEGICYERPEYNVKVIADFSIETEGESERTLNKVINKINGRLERQMDGVMEDRYVSAKVGVFPKGTDVYLRLVYVGPGMFDDVENPLETRDDYFRGVMAPIKKDINLIYQILGGEF